MKAYVVISPTARNYITNKGARDIAQQALVMDLDKVEEGFVIEHHCVIESETGPREVIASVVLREGKPFCHINMGEEIDYVEAT